MAEPHTNGAVHAQGVDRRDEAERIERGGPTTAGTVADLLARVRRPGTGSAPAEPRAAGGPEQPRDLDGRPRDLEGLASAITAKAARFLPDARIDAETDLFDAGATSVDAVELVAVLARELDVQLRLDDVFADARPRRLAQRWLTETGSPDTPGATGAHLVPRPPAPAAARPAAVAGADEDLALITADLALADRLPYVGPPQPAAPRRILLTGATGFLGGHILLDLLRRSDAHVVCLVRAADDEQAQRRLGDALTGFSLPWSAEVRRRVTVLRGDIRQPRLGLADDRWDALASEVDSIVSVAAAVDFLRGYPSLRQSNVLGPLTLAELAVTGPVKPLHHVSSVAVFNELGIASMGEDDPTAHIDRLAAGYDRTKWTAEAALRRAREHGLTVTLLRPGGIGGHTSTGAYNGHDLSSGFMAAFTRFRTVPAFRFLNLAPVDWVSKVAAAVVCDPEAWGHNYHLVGKPGTLPDVVRDMQLGGMNVRVLGWDEWRADFIARVEKESAVELQFLARVLQHPAAVELCEATLLGPAATAARTEAFVARHKLPGPTRYDGRAQVKTLERLAADGRARLPGRDDQPYLWFHETMQGTLDGAPCALSMTLSIASMYQLAQERRIDVRGEVTCARLHAQPLAVETGDIWVRPGDGVPHRHGSGHPLLRYRLLLRDRDGRAWWLEGIKTARARRDLWRQATTLAIEVGRDGEAAGLTGEVVVPRESYVREQIDGIRLDPKLSPQEQRAGKAMWLAWFGAQVGWGLLEPALRVGAELLDLRRGATGKELDR